MIHPRRGRRKNEAGSNPYSLLILDFGERSSEFLEEVVNEAPKILGQQPLDMPSRIFYP
jgi:hypothetical protein